MVGTSGAFRTVYESAQPQARPGLFIHWVDDRRVVEGGSLSDGGALVHWLDDTLKGADGSLADRDPDSHGLTFLALLGGERSPGWHQHAKGAVEGLTFQTTALDIRQAGLEGTHTNLVMRWYYPLQPGFFHPDSSVAVGSSVAWLDRRKSSPTAGHGCWMVRDASPRAMVCMRLPISCR